MNIVLLFIIGLVVAYLFTFYSKSDSHSKDYMLGVLGAVIGGILLDNFNLINISHFNFVTLSFGVVTAIGLIYTGRMLRSI